MPVTIRDNEDSANLENDRDEDSDVLGSLVLDPTVIVEVLFKDPVYDTNSPETVGDSPSILIESVVVMMVNDIIVMDRSDSVDSGSIVATGGLKVD